MLPCYVAPPDGSFLLYAFLLISSSSLIFACSDFAYSRLTSFLSCPRRGPLFCLSLLATVDRSSHYHWQTKCPLESHWWYTCTHSQPHRVPCFSPHDEVGLVDVPSAFAVPENAAVAHHRALLQGQLQRVVLGRRKDGALLAHTQTQPPIGQHAKPLTHMHNKYYLSLNSDPKIEACARVTLRSAKRRTSASC